MENDVMTDDDAMLSQYVRWFEEAEETSWDARQKSERDRDYVDGKQLTPKQLATLTKRKQPPVVFNVIKDKVGYLQGVEKSQRTDPKAHPRTPNHDQDAEAATDALRYVCEHEDYHTKRSRVFKNIVVEGIGGIKVVVRAKRSRRQLQNTTAMTSPRYEVDLKRVRWDRFFYDPHSSEPDFSDASYMGEVVWMDFDEAKLTYKGHEEDLNVTYNATQVGDTYDDKPKWKLWADKTRKRIRIVQMYHKRGDEWHFCEFTRGKVLKSGPSPFLDEDGVPVNPMIMESAYVDRENNRYGEVRQYIDPQDEINKRRSKGLHLLNTNQIIYEKGAGVESRRVREELAKPDGAVELPPGVMRDGAFQIERNSDLSAGQSAFYQDAVAFMDKSGPNAAMLGDAEGQSGRAIQAQQQGGMMEMGDLLDTLRRFDVRVYRSVWNRVGQFWTEKRWVRVTDNEKNVRFVGFNRPMTVQEQLAELPDEQRAMEMQRMGMMPNDPRLNMVTRVQNQVAEMDVDIIFDDAPDTVTIQSEQFAEIMKVMPALMQAPPQYTRLIIQMSQLRNKEELLKSLEGAQDPQQAAIQKLQVELQMQREQREQDEITSRAELNRARSVNEIQNAQMPPTLATQGR